MRPVTSPPGVASSGGVVTGLLWRPHPAGACHGLFFLCGVAEGTEESAAPTPTGQRKSEEPPRTEPQKEADGLCLVPDGAGCPRIHSRRFRE